MDNKLDKINYIKQFKQINEQYTPRRSDSFESEKDQIAIHPHAIQRQPPRTFRQRREQVPHLKSPPSDKTQPFDFLQRQTFENDQLELLERGEKSYLYDPLSRLQGVDAIQANSFTSQKNSDTVTEDIPQRSALEGHVDNFKYIGDGKIFSVEGVYNRRFDVPHKPEDAILALFTECRIVKSVGNTVVFTVKLFEDPITSTMTLTPGLAVIQMTSNTICNATVILTKHSMRYNVTFLSNSTQMTINIAQFICNLKEHHRSESSTPTPRANPTTMLLGFNSLVFRKILDLLDVESKKALAISCRRIHTIVSSIANAPYSAFLPCAPSEENVSERLRDSDKTERTEQTEVVQTLEKNYERMNTERVSSSPKVLTKSATKALSEIKPTRIDGHTNFVRSLDISNDLKYFVSGASDRKVRLWDLKSPETKTSKVFSGPNSSVVSSTFIENTLAIAYKCGTVKYIPIMESDRVLTFDVVGGKIEGFLPLTKTAFVSWGEKVQLINYHHLHQAVLFTYAEHLRKINGVKPFGPRFVSISADRSIQIWDPNAVTPTIEKIRNVKTFNALEIIDENTFASGGESIVQLWDQRKLSEPMETLVFDAKVSCLNYYEKKLYVGTDRTVCVRSGTKFGEEECLIVDDKNGVSCVKICNECIIAGYRDGGINLWNTL
ncbi:hypothetical protein EIN_359330 [Entamoeba invadens IP1]|uniref:Uncharacterized protein n=1 Tax=Entamoeba invadens IP1 TaxID=370355 RepID=A0A0A1U7T7_ENTIV|nr:hypothetical protein EIN_359330 [Entamoeba invadens IP1]ELP90850.1 hypothetical protein EIN_359330 [Entamoeba invadens IP1]|eukprot:XP_004257621.1 hypothetical protein EIN_359330 [Entamoeba invadens IP1]